MTDKWNDRETLDGIERFKKQQTRKGERRRVVIDPRVLKEDKRTGKDRRG